MPAANPAAPTGSYTYGWPRWKSAAPKWRSLRPSPMKPRRTRWKARPDLTTVAHALAVRYRMPHMPAVTVRSTTLSSRQSNGELASSYHFPVGTAG